MSEQAKLGKEMLEEKKPRDLLKQAVQSGQAEQALEVQLSDKERKQVANNIDSKKKREQASKNPKGISQEFTGALMHFLPMVIGGAIGGLDTAVAAQEGFNQAALQEREQDRKDRQVATQEQIAQMRLQGGPMTEFQRRSLGLRERQLALEEGAEKRREKGLGLSFDKFDLTKSEKAQLSGKQVENLAALDKTLKSIDRIKTLKQKVNTGPLAGRGQSFFELFGAASPEFTELKAESENAVADYIKAISGAQAAEPEVQRLKRVAATIGDDDATFESKMNAFERIVQEAMESTTGAIKSGQPLKAGTIDSLIDKYMGPDAGRQTVSGREVMQPQLTPRQLRIQELRRKKAGQ